jgi:tryptophanyl-tRNA synthetase
VSEIESGCRSGTLGCVDCKKQIAARLTDVLAPFREKRAELEANPGVIRDILADGEQRARARAQMTMGEVHSAMKLG